MWTKGVCLPTNPGGAIGIGVVVKELAKVLEQFSDRVEAAPTNTNIAAEYMALIKGMNWLLENNLAGRYIMAYCDTKFVVEQMLGYYGAGSGNYVEYYKEAFLMLPQFKQFKIVWTPAVKNTDAKDLSLAKLDDTSMKMPPRKTYFQKYSTPHPDTKDLSNDPDFWNKF